VGAVREHLEHCPYCDGVFKRIAALADGARSLYGEAPGSCAASLDRTLFDRVAPVSAGGLELWVAFSERGLTMSGSPPARRSRPRVSAGAGAAPAAASGASFESFVWSHFKRFGKELRRAALPGESRAPASRRAGGSRRRAAGVDWPRCRPSNVACSRR
jgi:hypothetical protein